MQHAAGRTGPLKRLLPLLPPAVDVVTDAETADPNPWRNYVRCLSDPPEDASHVCVIQDDAVPCRDFAAAVDAVVEARPDDVVSLWVGGLPNRTRKDFYAADAAGRCWSPVWFRDIHHVVCLVWPVGLAAEFLRWSETARIPSPKPVRSDDLVVGYWARMTRRTVWATVPCLVEHPDDVPSTIRVRASGRGDRGRTAIRWIGADADPLEIDWSSV